MFDDFSLFPTTSDARRQVLRVTKLITECLSVLYTARAEQTKLSFKSTIGIEAARCSCVYVGGTFFFLPPRIVLKKTESTRV